MPLPRLVGLIAFALATIFGERAAVAASSTVQPGTILCAKVEGDVSVTVRDDKRAMKVGDAIPTNATVSTGSNGKAVLVFSNGTTVQAEPNTELRVTTFRQGAVPQTISLSAISVEPSQSETRILLQQGRVLTNLKTRPDSTVHFETPVGIVQASAGTFMVSMVPTATGMDVEVASLSAPLLFADPAGKNAPVKIPPGQKISARVVTKG